MEKKIIKNLEMGCPCNETQPKILIAKIPLSKFNHYEWKADHTPTTTTTTPIKGFEFVFAIIGVLSATYLIKRGR